MDFNLKKINLQKGKKKKGKKLWTFVFLVVAIFVLWIVWSALSSTSSTSVFNFISKIAPYPLKSTDDRVNILLLGNAGGTHDGPSLTDSIIVASYSLKTNNVLLISIPRDLWIDSAKAKVNAIYEYGERKERGLDFAKENLEEVLGFPIHYGVRLDFSGFAKAIDIVGGLEIEVPKTFDDYLYPIEGKEDDLCGHEEKEIELTEEGIKALNLPSPLPTGMWFSSPAPTPGKRKVLVDLAGKIATSSAAFTCRFEHISFKKGKTLMDGEVALKFVRSRMGTNGEGSDFARSRRQQFILQSFRSQALSIETLSNPKKITSLIATLGDSIETDIPIERFLDFYNLSKKQGSVESLVLGDLGDGKSILITPSFEDYGGAFVLVPKDNDVSLIHKFLKEKFNEDINSK